MQATMQNETNKQEFDGILTAGLIIGIVFSSITIAILGIAMIYCIAVGSLASSVGLGLFFGGSIFIVTIMLLIFMIGPIVTLILTVRFLKGKSDNKTTVGVLNLLFCWLVSGILILVGAYKQDNMHNSTSHVSQNDQEYQEFLRNKQNGVNK